MHNKTPEEVLAASLAVNGAWSLSVYMPDARRLVRALNAAGYEIVSAEIQEMRNAE